MQMQMHTPSHSTTRGRSRGTASRSRSRSRSQTREKQPIKAKSPARKQTAKATATATATRKGRGKRVGAKTPTRRKTEKKVPMMKEEEESADEDAMQEGIPYEVSGIIGKRHASDGTVEYRVQWKGWPKPTWEPSENLDGCKELVQRFEQQQQMKVEQKTQERMEMKGQEGEAKKRRPAAAAAAAIPTRVSPRLHKLAEEPTPTAAVPQKRERAADAAAEPRAKRLKGAKPPKERAREAPQETMEAKGERRKYAVAGILGKKQTPSGVEYLISWAPSEEGVEYEPTYEPASNIPHELIQAYELQLQEGARRRRAAAAARAAATAARPSVVGWIEEEDEADDMDAEVELAVSYAHEEEDDRLRKSTIGFISEEDEEEQEEAERALREAAKGVIGYVNEDEEEAEYVVVEEHEDGATASVTVTERRYVTDAAGHTSLSETITTSVTEVPSAAESAEGPVAVAVPGFILPVPESEAFEDVQPEGELAPGAMQPSSREEAAGPEPFASVPMEEEEEFGEEEEEEVEREKEEKQTEEGERKGSVSIEDEELPPIDVEVQEDMRPPPAFEQAGPKKTEMRSESEEKLVEAERKQQMHAPHPASFSPSSSPSSSQEKSQAGGLAHRLGGWFRGLGVDPPSD